MNEPARTAGGLAIPGDVADRLGRDPSLLDENMPRPVVEEHEPRKMPTEAVARSTDPGTSWGAARSIPEDQLRQSQAAVLAALREFGPATDETLAERYKARRLQVDWPLQSPSGLRTRRHELTEAGYVEDSGRLEKLPSNRWSIVWQVVE